MRAELTSTAKGQRVDNDRRQVVPHILPRRAVVCRTVIPVLEGAIRTVDAGNAVVARAVRHGPSVGVVDSVLKAAARPLASSHLQGVVVHHGAGLSDQKDSASADQRCKWGSREVSRNG